MCSYIRRYNCSSRFGISRRNDRFEWDDEKNRRNIEKHGLDFADAEGMFRSGLLCCPDIREDYGERRWIGIGKIQGRTAVVIFVDRGEDNIRIISLRKAIQRESRQYEKTIKDELETR